MASKKPREPAKAPEPTVQKIKFVYEKADDPPVQVAHVRYVDDDEAQP